MSLIRQMDGILVDGGGGCVCGGDDKGNGVIKIEDFIFDVSNEIRQSNYQFMKNDISCRNIISELNKIWSLLDKIGNLAFLRNLIQIDDKVFSGNMISTSIESTMGSVISCCENCCIADANALLRKYRDDLLFWIYLLAYDSLSKTRKNEEKKKTKKQIDLWLENNLRNLKTETVLSYIVGCPELEDVIKKYGIEDSFRKIGRRLNNFVHGNGWAYYNRNFTQYRENELTSELNRILEDAKYITVTFLVLVILCAPILVMSYDYTDHLDCGDIPPEDSQYWVAPFINDFLRENISLIDDACLTYLREQTNMCI